MLIERNGYLFEVDFSHPYRRFKGKSAKLPRRADPAPTPESVQEGAAAAGETERLLLKKKKGRRSTILTEGGLGTTQPQKSSVLGLTV